MICDPCKAAGRWLNSAEAWMAEGADRIRMRIAALHAECPGGNNCECQHSTSRHAINRELVSPPASG